MKKNTKIFLIMVSLALLVFTLESCKTDTVEQPSPLGPSSIAIILDLNANPNVIVAGKLDRQTVEITATLKKYDGNPISDRAILFEVVNIDGRRLNLGYLDGELSMQTVATDAGGTALTHYYGPLKKEIRSNTDLYIRATVVWEGEQFIQDTTQLYIIRDDN
jgi:hypothetical protein